MSASRKNRGDVKGATSVSEPATQASESQPGDSEGDALERELGEAGANEEERFAKDATGSDGGETAAQQLPAPHENRQRRNGRQESRHQRFLRLAKRRLAKAVKSIAVLGPLANKSQYESTPEDRAFVLGRLNDAVLKIKSDYSDTVDEPVSAYRFPSEGSGAEQARPSAS